MTEKIYTPDVVIVGGGVAGLTVALNLAPRKVCVITKNILEKFKKEGVKVHLFDKDPDYLDELYQASENTISNIILKNSTKNTLIVSHNPSLSQTISSLRKEEFKNYPTCTFGCFFRKESDDDFVNTILINSANGKIIDL